MLLKTTTIGGFVLLLALGARGQLHTDQQAAATLPLSAGPPRLRVEHKGLVTCLAWSPEGKRIATGTGEGTIRIIDVASGKEVQNFTIGTAAGEFSWSPDGKKLAIMENDPASRYWLRVWNVNSGKLEKSDLGRLCFVIPNMANMANNVRKPDHAVFTFDGQAVLAVGVGSFHRSWDVSGVKTLIHVPAGFPAIAADGSTYGWCDPTGQCSFQKYSPVPANIQFTTLQVGTARCIAFGPGGKHLAVGGDEKEVQLWDLATKKPTAKLTGLQKPATKLVFSGDGKTLAAVSGDGNSVRVWDLTRASARCQINHNRGQLDSMALSPDGKMLATTAKDGKSLYVWSASARLLTRSESPLELTVKEMASLWAELANTDYQKADAAWRKLGQAGDNAIPFLRGQMRAIAVPAADLKRIDTLVGELNAEKFATREQATAELLAVGELAIVPLQRVLEKPPSGESRERASLLLKKISEPRLTPDRQRVLDAIELLEQQGTDKARGLLEETERDALIPQIRLQAKQALERMRR